LKGWGPLSGFTPCPVPSESKSSAGIVDAGAADVEVLVDAATDAEVVVDAATDAEVVVDAATDVEGVKVVPVVP